MTFATCLNLVRFLSMSTALIIPYLPIQPVQCSSTAAAWPFNMFKLFCVPGCFEILRICFSTCFHVLKKQKIDRKLLQVVRISFNDQSITSNKMYAVNLCLFLQYFYFITCISVL